MDDWMEALRGARVEPMAAAHGRIAEEVRRRRARRRTVGLGVASGATVLSVGIAAVLLPLGGTRPDDAPTPGAPATTASAVPSEAPNDGDLFSCPQRIVFRDEAVLVTEYVDASMPRWKRIYAEITAADFDGFAVHRAEIIHIGVVALVTGDVEEAERVLVGEYGVTAVEPWPPAAGSSVEDVLDLALQRAAQQALAEARRRTRGIPGSAGFGSWASEGLVIVEWKEPVPAEVRALEDLRFEGGGRIAIQGVRYSERDLNRAINRLTRARESGELNVWGFGGTHCADGRGVVVMLTPEDLGDHRAEWQEQLTEIAGMPVMVVGEGYWHNPDLATPGHPG